MKKMFFLLVGFIFMMQSCSSQIFMDRNSLEEVTKSQEFTFMAQRAQPTSYDAINTMNTFPNTSASRMLNLDYGYTLVLKKQLLEVTLPYFGTRYNSSYNTDSNSFRFTSKDFLVTKKEDKKGNIIYTIQPKDVRNINTMFLEIKPNGGAYLSVNANDRQPISYDGFIMKNEAIKEKVK